MCLSTYADNMNEIMKERCKNTKGTELDWKYMDGNVNEI